MAYLPSRQYGYIVLDDPDYVSQNPAVRDGITPAGMKWAFTSFHASNWHPLTWLSLMLDSELFGPEAGPRHLENSVIHAANALLIFVFLFRATGLIWPAAIVGGLFAWHPAHVESVAWISERKDVLSAFFGFLSLLAYQRYVSSTKNVVSADEKPRAQQTNKAPAGAGAAKRAWTLCIPHSASYFYTLIFFALALLSKPMLVTLPFVLLLLDFWPFQRSSFLKSRVAAKTDAPRWRQLVLEKWPFFVLAGFSCVLTIRAQQAAIAPMPEYSMSFRIGGALISWARYLWMTFWPMNLAISYPPADKLPVLQVAGAAAVLSSISIAAWQLRKSKPYVLFGWLWFLGTLVPVIGLVQVGSQPVADRYTYIPLIGIFIAVVWAGAEIARRVRAPILVVAGGLCVVFGAMLFMTERQLNYWENSEKLFSHTIAVTKNNAFAHASLGAALRGQGREYDSLTEFREALRLAEEHPHLADAVLTQEQKATAFANLGSEFERVGYAKDAVALYKHALECDAKNPLAQARLNALSTNSAPQ
jgi:protein O-mannosyl-transferase